MSLQYIQLEEENQRLQELLRVEQSRTRDLEKKMVEMSMEFERRLTANDKPIVFRALVFSSMHEDRLAELRLDIQKYWSSQGFLKKTGLEVPISHIVEGCNGYSSMTVMPMCGRPGFMLVQQEEQLHDWVLTQLVDKEIYHVSVHFDGTSAGVLL